MGDDANVAIMMITTNEELMIARETRRVCETLDVN